MVIRWTQCERDAMRCAEEGMIQDQDSGEYVCDNSEVMLSKRVGVGCIYMYVNSLRHEEANLSKRDANKRKRKQKVQEGKT